MSHESANMFDPELDAVLQLLAQGGSGELELRHDDTPEVIEHLSQTICGGFERLFGKKVTHQLDGQFTANPVLRFYVEEGENMEMTSGRDR